MPEHKTTTAAATPVESVLRPAGPAAAALAETGWVLITGATLIFGVITGLLWWVLRHRALAEPVDAAEGVEAERRLVRRWVMLGGLWLPAAVLVALLGYTAARSGPWQPGRSAGEPVIAVTAHLWWWQVRYDDPARGVHFTLANEIHVPVGRPVTLGVTSADVIHALWLPSLAGKVDVLPGRVHQLRLQADRAGAWRGRCAEFCGDQHARMGLLLVAHAPQDYERWLSRQARPAAQPADALAVRGRALFQRQRCDACHQVRGLTDTPAIVAPDLTHVGSRREIGAGVRPLDRAALAAWIADPQAWKPGVRMPSYGARLRPDELDALAAFVAQLD